MKILILTRDIPYPLTMGGNIAQFVFTDYLRKIIDITYVFEIRNEDDRRNSDTLKNIWNDVTIVDVYCCGMEFANRASTISILFEAVKKVYRTLRHCLSLFNKKINGQHGQTVNEKNIFDHALWYLKPLSRAYILFVEKFIEEHKFDLIQIEQVPFLSLACLQTKSPKLYVHHEIQSELLSSAENYTHEKNLFTSYVKNLTQTIETNLLAKFDHTIVFSNADKDKLEKKGIKNVSAIPFSALYEKEVKNSRVSGNIIKLTFIGGDIHPPNIDAVLWYSEIGKHVYEKTGLKLHVIGNWRRENINRFSCEFIVFEGFVEDLYQSLFESINVVPLRIGSGIRTKILSAFNMKVPVISTRIGIEGINATDGEHYYYFDNKDVLTDRILLLRDKHTERFRITEEAYRLINEKYKISNLASQRIAVYEQLISNHN